MFSLFKSPIYIRSDSHCTYQCTTLLYTYPDLLYLPPFTSGCVKGSGKTHKMTVFSWFFSTSVTVVYYLIYNSGAFYLQISLSFRYPHFLTPWGLTRWDQCLLLLWVACSCGLNSQLFIYITYGSIKIR